MILEIAEIKIKQDCGEAFVAGVEKSLPLFKAASGFRDFKLVQCIEAPDTFRLLIHWDKLEDHMVSFRNSPDYEKWRANVGHCSECISA
jgi:heme-degrading monooxygenase HmoA